MTITLDDIKRFKQATPFNRIDTTIFVSTLFNISILPEKWLDLLELAEKALGDEKDIKSRFDKIIDEYRRMPIACMKEAPEK